MTATASTPRRRDHSRGRVARPPERHGHVPVHRHRGLDAAPRAAGRRLRAGPRRAPAARPGRDRRRRRHRGRHRGRLVLRRVPQPERRDDRSRRGAAALAAGGWPSDVKVPVRMGIHTGEATVRGDDYVGLEVHRAARIGAAAHGGQVICRRRRARSRGPAAAGHDAARPRRAPAAGPLALGADLAGRRRRAAGRLPSDRARSTRRRTTCRSSSRASSDGSSSSPRRGGCSA